MFTDQPQTTMDLTTPDGIRAIYPQHFPAVTRLEQLSGGNANYVWRAHLFSPLEDGSQTLVIKHAEAHLKMDPKTEMDDNRMVDEQAALGLFATAGPLHDVVRDDTRILVPTVYHYDATTKTLYMSDFGAGRPTLKEFLINPAFAADRFDPQRLRDLGRAIGGFLRTLHDTGRQNLSRLDGVLNEKMGTLTKQQLIYEYYYKQYKGVMSKLGISGLEEAVAAVEAFAESDAFYARETFVMGDFWPGNMLVNPKSLDSACVVDWEMARIGVPTLDVSQFCAELYMAEKFKGSAAAKDVMKGLIETYGSDRLDLRAFAIGLAMHVAVVATYYGWETDEEKLRQVVKGAAVYAERAHDADFVRTIFE
ncbi:Carboxy-terminal domain (CTD) phosphatase [Geranomyces variabilis]|nr:Carboxy-terminal domain (CTD) phosphatase [Geranomyces variabilis]